MYELTARPFFVILLAQAFCDAAVPSHCSKGPLVPHALLYVTLHHARRFGDGAPSRLRLCDTKADRTAERSQRAGVEPDREAGEELGGRQASTTTLCKHLPRLQLPRWPPTEQVQQLRLHAVQSHERGEEVLAQAAAADSPYLAVLFNDTTAGSGEGDESKAGSQPHPQGAAQRRVQVAASAAQAAVQQEAALDQASFCQRRAANVEP